MISWRVMGTTPKRSTSSPPATLARMTLSAQLASPARATVSMASTMSPAPCQRDNSPANVRRQQALVVVLDAQGLRPLKRRGDAIEQALGRRRFKVRGVLLIEPHHLPGVAVLGKADQAQFADGGPRRFG